MFDGKYLQFLGLNQFVICFFFKSHCPVQEKTLLPAIDSALPADWLLCTGCANIVLCHSIQT